MINEDYDISIIGKQSYDGDAGEITLNTVGSYTKRGKIRYISYKEYYEGTASRTAVLKIEDEKVTMIHGKSATRLVLEKGIRHRCHYDTGYGSLTLGIFTSDFISSLEDSGGRLNVKYTMDIDSSISSFNEITVDVKRRNLQ